MGSKKSRPQMGDKSPEPMRRRAGRHHPAYGCLEGTVQVAPGVDLTQPADPDWGDYVLGEIGDGATKDNTVFHPSVEQMTFDEFKRSLSQPEPLAELAPALAGLWWAAKDDWEKAHRVVMNGAGKECAWVHAHLHRLEGDLDNAGYWYKQAGKPVASGSLPAEWEAIAHALLDEKGRC